MAGRAVFLELQRRGHVDMPAMEEAMVKMLASGDLEQMRRARTLALESDRLRCVLLKCEGERERMCVCVCVCMCGERPAAVHAVEV